MSKALTIKSKGTSIVQYGRNRASTKNFKGLQPDQGAANEKAGTMQRVAVQLRQK